MPRARDIGIVIGTGAVAAKGVAYRDLALVVVDVIKFGAFGMIALWISRRMRLRVDADPAVLVSALPPPAPSSPPPSWPPAVPPGQTPGYS